MEAMARQKMSKAALARATKIDYSYLSRMLSGKARFNETYIESITNVLGIARASLPPLSPSLIVRAKSFKGADLPDRREELLEVPVMGDPAAAGAGRIVSDDDVAGVAWIPRDQLAGRDRHTLRAIRISGHSMEPMIHDGALVVIDCDDREKIDPNAVYAVRDDGEGVTLKHIVFREREHKLILVANNRNLLLYPPREVDLKRDASPVIGRAIWVGQGIA
jgi:phage repressor protein C with HTH and peptisase S24 domain